MSMAEKKRVLVIGGSGYLGQHLLDRLAKADGEVPFLLAFTHHRPVPPPELIDAISPVLHFRVDLRTGEGFKFISNTFGKPHVVVNCGALSDPRACEEDPYSAISTNVPFLLFDWLSSFGDDNILLIQLSTDQVYEGTKSFYKEEDEPAPVNTYGKSKAVAEQFISDHWSNFAFLRSSIIYGPQTISPVSKSLPVQWMDNDLSRREEIKVFDDEFRCPVFVKDVVNVIVALTKKWISVYEGTKSFYKEEDEPAPVNTYGKSKAVAEQFISDHWSNFAFLRSSIIYGPQTISPVSKSLPVQWMDSGLSHREEIKFFDDEYRCPVFVKDVVNVIVALTKKWISDGNQIKLVLNVGGPDRLSRVQMAEAIADYRGYDRSLIKPISASSINRGVKSPTDISMDISKLIALLGKSPISFKDGVKLTLENAV